MRLSAARRWELTRASFHQGKKEAKAKRPDLACATPVFRTMESFLKKGLT
jgi:ribosome maturation protein Sdo1